MITNHFFFFALSKLINWLIVFAGSLDESLWFLYKYVRDAAEREEILDEVLVPMIEHVINYYSFFSSKFLLYLSFYYLINLSSWMNISQFQNKKRQNRS